MLTREQAENVAGAMWDKAVQMQAVELTLGDFTREGYIAEVLDAFDRAQEAKLLPLDAAIAAVRRAEANGSLRYRVAIDPEFEGPEGFFASGDDDFDRETCRNIRKQLAAGNDWAWCIVEVSCTIPGYDAVGSDSLGGCNYADKEDFCQPGGYYDDMKAEARADLIDLIAKEIVNERKRL